jgi:hypothetical protein
MRLTNTLLDLDLNRRLLLAVAGLGGGVSSGDVISTVELERAMKGQLISRHRNSELNEGRP